MAEDKTISLSIVTPEGVALEVVVDELTAPSVDGEFGVLPGHRPLMAALRTGIVSYRRGDEATQVAVGPGFVEILDDRAVLLTDQFTTKAAIDAVRVRLELKEATAELGRYDGEPGDGDYRELVVRQLWAAAQLELYGDPPVATLGAAALDTPVDESYSSTPTE